ncbi:protein translocase subunit SecD [Halobacteriovorax sp. GB3]|uniref:protein translocase subunit SecD n=1 Tax=Halobacteriovorax sp. GB3 TaxID=2719615 RepID=UPI002362FE98|nr:protein translocase subunit SecD [Halobacteriovorax sp. GB3]MDD0852758.1 protein translocase subunit SecD [Halobacteriovorax sp. GB3]
MKRSWWYRFIFLIAVTVMSIVVVIPTVMDFNEESNYPVKSKINLGLDLQGGLYMILGIDFKKVYKDEVRSYARKIEYTMKDDAGVIVTGGEIDATDPLDPKMEIMISSASDVQKTKDKIHEFFNGLLRITGEDTSKIQIALTNNVKRTIEEQSVTKSIEVIRNRIDEFGVTEPEIVSQGKDRIIVQLPGVKDIDRAKELIGRTAKLEFKLVNDQIPMAQVQSWLKKTEDAGIVFNKGDRFSDYIKKVNENLKDELPKNYILAFEKKVSKATNEVELKIPYLVDLNPRITGDDLADARVLIDQQKNEPYVSLDFKKQGADRFEKVTGENIGRRMAIILDGNVYSAPNIQTRIAGGRAQITLGSGNFNQTMKEARDLALVLRAGALPVQLDFLEQRTVGPSLGHDSIDKARFASLVGCALVFIFIFIYYRVSGAVAMVTLSLNVLFVLAALVGLEATLTLPGIAGIALTIGMAVDANIIIYERIREEIRKGVTNYKAVEKGFEQAFWTIIDANITTALAGLCLLNFGTGPIRGFAVTLLIGIVATVYTSYFAGRLFFEFYMDKVEGQDLSI